MLPAQYMVTPMSASLYSSYLASDGGSFDLTYICKAWFYTMTGFVFITRWFRASYLSF